eukprot:TRINITY_DN6552_c0_g1_i1.p2 TRINITY_DN6552_c0_g1~~TRINITY_DN6552_c0_g1_i1.p2  ORF type:complete len:239 (-),score=44.79 TRINITY_DN6552_c0_g1_i1:227-943(-)
MAGWMAALWCPRNCATQDAIVSVEEIDAPSNGSIGAPFSKLSAQDHEQADDAIAVQGAKGHFVVELTLEDDEDLGIDVRVPPSEVVRIARVRDGRVKRWNASRAESEQRVRDGDRIVEVNGTRRTGAILAAFSKASILAGSQEVRLRMVVEPRIELDVVIIKEASLCIDVTFDEGFDFLPIVKIHHGPIKRWNEDNLARQINVGDYIVEIEGIRGDCKQLLERLTLTGTVHMTIASFQ